VNVPVWVAELAAWFWARAGGPEPFPRKLLGPIVNAVPLAVVFVPRPTIAWIVRWLQENRIDCPVSVPNRTLRACLVARRGQGFVFVDGADAEDERRFSLAHELAHYLRDYLYPRQRALNCLGPEAAAVLDGDRPPTAAERVHALMGSVRVGYHVHLMDRDGEGGDRTDAIADAERCADRLAYELLAPAEHLRSIVIRTGRQPELSPLSDMLTTHYGLPRPQAHRYATLLCPPVRPGDPLLRWLSHENRPPCRTSAATEE
jgi:hypothetical protein